MNVNLTERLHNIFHLHFPTQQELASTFLRFQENYESPQFKGKIFTLDEFERWYIANSPGGKGTGKFTYSEDWSGFNIPSYILNPFYEGSFDPLSEPEVAFLELFKDKKETKFYVIGSFGEKQESLNHEVAHGLYYTQPEYKAKVLEVLSNMDPEDRSNLTVALLAMGYDQSVLDDEIQAYVVDDMEWLSQHKIEGKGFVELHRQLREIFDRYAMKEMIITG